MLRILLIILVALAVIIGLMRLTGARSGDAVPAADPGAVAPVVEEAPAAAPPAEETILDEPAVDALDVPVDVPVEGATDAPMEAAEPAIPESAPAEPSVDNAAPPAADPNTPGR